MAYSRATVIEERTQRTCRTSFGIVYGRVRTFSYAGLEKVGTGKKSLLEGIARGEKAIEDGRTVTHAQAKQRMARWLK
jgi:hypothetical protein